MPYKQQTVMSYRVLPLSKNNLRACLSCGILLTLNAFIKEGCPNCDALLTIKDSDDPEERALRCTSPNHEGHIAMMSASASWVAKWQRTDKFVGGLYATKVQGRLPDDCRRHGSEWHHLRTTRWFCTGLIGGKV